MAKKPTRINAAERLRAGACFLFAAVALFFHGCAAAPAPGASDVQEKAAYDRALGRWSRSARVYDGFNLKLMASVTFKSREFRAAYAREYARVYKLPKRDRNKLFSDQRRAAKARHEFVLAAYVPDERENDFSARKSVWKVYLKAPGHAGALKPLEIRKMKRKESFLSHFFPYVTPWKSLYIVRFPATFPDGAPNGPVSLVIAGVGGTAEMTWSVNEKRPAP
ncbi:conserved exported hypothetical protein [Candidatus Desulfarcum epimagneticum]|uniref:Lipoprotein n=1 Tax=uncultured Desulfobacteraceae bacterium TaxID=218296 RepID=A0A484HQF1_9BACT|nr:conserved exported hypothetical protein [uncultured Desulfobacteraceae bacterium]